MGKFIPVEPEKWAEMVKAQAEVARLKAEVERLNNESDILQKCCEHQKNRIERLKAEVEEMKSEVTYQKQKAQEMVEFICECVAKGDFKAYKNGGVRFGLKAKKGGQP